MRRQRLFQRVMTTALVLSAAALCAAVAFPHYHDASTHRQESCRACKIQEGFSATKPASAHVVLQPQLVTLVHIPSLETPCLTAAGTLHTPRAPPLAS